MLIKYPIFTACDGIIDCSAKVEAYRMPNGDDIPALLVGKPGPGNRLEMLPISGAYPGDTITAASLVDDTTPPTLIATNTSNTLSHAIVVFREPIPNEFTEFAGEILAEGRIVSHSPTGRIQGDGYHLITIIPRGAVVTVYYYGRRARNRLRLYKFTGKQLITATPQQLETMDIF